MIVYDIGAFTLFVDGSLPAIFPMGEEDAFFTTDSPGFSGLDFQGKLYAYLEKDKQAWRDFSRFKKKQRHTSSTAPCSAVLNVFCAVD